MHRIRCPWCGLRDESEFQYYGDASVARPDASAESGDFSEYVYQRTNPKGWHREYWHHVGGCRRWLIVERNTATHQIRSVEFARPVKESA
ncbi:MAG: sarcosine oxidase subunit delta [Pseudomonadota bacterium]